ncbi:hypothetical protein [uncultured Thiodictyon sp.]|uniref:hypothetical protein n=1 Tax=uncultured Thiodictyon sp. TaxID=1846217 RepID=UPI0025E7EC6F|nr:hypothetical protein [uncultured Thiodictyon sp.]
MNRSIISAEVLPFLGRFGALVLATLIVDVFLHLLGLAWVGRYLGIPGTLLILLSFFYSMRKRKLIAIGRPKTLLRMHEVFTWLGALMILVHAGIHVYAILPWLALIALLVTVLSGMTGEYLLERGRRHLAAKRAEQAAAGLAPVAVEQEVFWDTVTVDAMKQWRTVHFPITLAFGVLGLAHILSILVFWQWR